MKKIYLLLLSFIGLISADLSAQSCGTDYLHQQRYNNDANYRSQVDAMTAQWAAFKSRPLNLNELIAYENNDTIYEIPVVFHVMHSGEAIGTTNNPSEATILAYLDYLNQTFAATWPLYVNEQNGGVRFPIRFKIAKRTPGCNPQPTNGINRVKVTDYYPVYANWGIKLEGSTGVSDADLKALSMWDRDYYYNIWLVNYIDGPGGGVGGYAYLPPAPVNQDGNVMLVRYTTPYPNGSYYFAFPHEIGHSFGLLHTFQGSSGPNSCPPLSNCQNTGDLICDTEPHDLQSGACPSGTNGCTGMPYNNVQYNIMNYTNCANRFTHGQKERFLFHLFNYRSTLIYSLGATPLTEVPNPTTAAVCTPTLRSSYNNNDCGPVSVKIADLHNITGTYSSDNMVNYQNYVCNFMPTRLKQGETYTLQVGTRTNPQHARVWIDYNNNGTFEAGELVLSSTASSSTFTHTQSIIIPSAAGVATCTPVRMRVSADISSNPIANVTPCAALNLGQHEDYTVIIEPNVPVPAATIAASTGTTICTSANVTLSANVTNPHVTSQFLWYKNGTYLASGMSYNTTGINNNDVFTFRVTYPGACNATDTITSNALTFQVVSTVTPTVTINTSQSLSICTGQLITFNATATNVGSTPVYQWKVNGSNAGTNSSTFASSTLGNNDVVTCEVTSSLTCTTTPTAVSNGLTVSVSANVQPAVSITASQTNLCIASSVTFTAVPVNGGTPQYQWKVNGINAGTNSATFTTATLQAGDFVTCEMTSDLPCASPLSATSNTITMTNTPNVVPTISIASGLANNTACQGQTVTFTSTTSNGGLNPVYQWKVNGINTGTNSATYTVSNLNNNDVVSCFLTSNAPCISRDTASSNAITMTVLPVSTPTIQITATASTICENTPVTFTATATNTGTTPVYTWKVNGNITGTNATTYTSSTLNNNDVVTCELQSSLPCVTAALVTSNGITMQVQTNATPTVSITSSAGVNICNYSTIQLTATTTNGGTSPSFAWTRNGSPIGSNSPSVTLGNFVNGDQVYVTVTSNAICVLNNTAQSNTLTFSVTTPNPITVTPDYFADYCRFDSLELEVSNADGTIEWYDNSGLIPGENDTTIRVYSAGRYYATNTVNGCVARSNTATAELLPVPTPVLLLKNGAFEVPSTFDSYKWYFNNVLISGNTTYRHVPQAYGYFKVCVYKDDCNACSEVYHHKDPLGIGDIYAANGIKVYPNPTTGLLSIDYSQNVNLTIRSVDGRILKTADNTLHINISDLSDGVYMLYIADKDNNVLQVNKITKSL